MGEEEQGGQQDGHRTEKARDATITHKLHSFGVDDSPKFTDEPILCHTVRTTGTAFRILAQRCGRGYTAGRLNRGAKCSTPPECYREGAKTMSTLVRRS